MNWIRVDEEIFAHVGKQISEVFIVPRWRGKYSDISESMNGGWTLSVAFQSLILPWRSSSRQKTKMN